MFFKKALFSRPVFQTSLPWFLIFLFERSVCQENGHRLQFVSVRWTLKCAAMKAKGIGQICSGRKL